MTSSVTVSGSNNTNITLTFDLTSNLALAQQIAARIATSVADGSLTTTFDTSGPPPTVPAGTTGGYYQVETNFVVLPSDYTVDLVKTPGRAVVIGSGARNEMIMSDSGTDLTFIATGGSGSVVAGGGQSLIYIPGTDRGNWSLFTGSGNDAIVALGHGNDTIGAGGGNNSIILGSGHDSILSVGNDSILGGTGAETVNATAAQSDIIQGDSSKLLFIGGSGGATILGGSGSDTYFGSNVGPVGNQLIKGGSRGHNLLFAGNGAATLIGGGRGDQLFAFGQYDQTLIAGRGNETLSAALSTGNDSIAAGSGRDLLIGGFGSDTFVGGSGHSTVQAGFAANTFEFINHEAGGTQLVTNIFDPNTIRIDLNGYGPGAVAKALASQTVSHGSVSITLTDGTKVTFQDVTSLNKNNFV